MPSFGNSLKNKSLPHWASLTRSSKWPSVPGAVWFRPSDSCLWNTGVCAQQQWRRENTNIRQMLLAQAQFKRGRKRNCEGLSVFWRMERVSQGMFLERVGKSPPCSDQTGSALCRRVGLLETGWMMEGSSLTNRLVGSADTNAWEPEGRIMIFADGQGGWGHSEKPRVTEVEGRESDTHGVNYGET